jgi:glutamate synthase (NADPH/NADH) small chain
MGKITGFLDYKRSTATEQPAYERLKHYKEFTSTQSEDELSIQGARCMDCGIPFCHTYFGCPVFNLIPEWNDFVYRRQWQEAFERLEITNNFPEITGRVCPAPCESACTLSINNSPVTIKQIELAIIEKAFSEGWVVPKKPNQLSGKSIAVIGSGPAGLAAAQELRRLGHEVTIFEKMPKPGGILRYGIPDFKLEKWVIDRRLNQLKEEGIQFEMGVDIGEDISARYLQKSFNVILLAMGAGKARDLNVDRRELAGIHFAMDYLTQSNLYIDGTMKYDQIISAKDKTVLVIGGGDTGSDCVGTANRQGAKKVYLFEILPKPKHWIETWNPEWPNWPNILRTSSSHKEGCVRDWSILTKSFSGKDGKLTTANFSRIEWKLNNQKSVFEETAGSEFSLEVDLVLLAMGFVHTDHNQLLKDLNIQFDRSGNIQISDDYMTSVDGVFAAGDAHTGASLVVKAIYNGREAAIAIDNYLTKC